MHKLLKDKHTPLYKGQEMVEFLANARFQDLPAEVVARAKHIVMDDIACTLAGRKTRGLYNTTLDHMAPLGDVTPVGCDFKTTAAFCAFLNALHAQTHDCNDGLNNSGMLGGAYHPGRTVVSVALAVGQQVHADGKDVLLAVVLGIEAAARMRNPSHDSVVADSYSGAVVAAKLMGANARQMRAAMSLSAFLCPGLKGAAAKHVYTATDAKNVGPTTNTLKYAYLCRSSVEAAELAMQGYDGPEFNDDRALTARYATCGLGKDYMCMDMYFKPWPCCRKTHGAIDAALALRNEYGVKPEDVERIRIFQQFSGMYVNNPIKADDDVCYGGQFSLQYTVSCALLDGELELRHFRWPDRKAPQKYVEFSKKITVEADDSLDGHNAISPNHAIVEAQLKDGRVLTVYSQYPLGSEPNGLTHEQRVAKLLAYAEDLTQEEKDRLVDWIWNLDTLDAM